MDTQGLLGVGDSSAWRMAPAAAPRIDATSRLAPGDKRSMAAQEVVAMIRGRSSIRPNTCEGSDETQEDEPDTASTKLFHGEGNTIVEPRANSERIAADSSLYVDPYEEQVPRTCEIPLPLPDMVGQSQSMLELSRLVRLVAPRSTTVLIEGETGTGKELVARAVHRLSKRSSKPFMVLNCAAIPETLLEAETLRTHSWRIYRRSAVSHGQD